MIECRKGNVPYISFIILIVVLTTVSFLFALNILAGQDKMRMQFREMDEVLKTRWEIVVPHGAKREFIYTNKVATHFSAEAADENSRSYHGLYCAMHEYLDSWNLVLGSKTLTGDDITKAFVYPHTIYRYYAGAGVIEEIFLPDGGNGLAVRFLGRLPGDCTLVPWVDMRFIWRVPKPDYKIFWMKDDNTLLISRADNSFPEGLPRWIAITSNVPLDFKFDEKRVKRTYWRDLARRAMSETYPFSPGRLSFDGSGRGKRGVLFVFALGKDEMDAVNEAQFILKNFKNLKEHKLQRIEDLFTRANISTSNERINKAYRWARVSMDNLIMNQRGRGIYAGFHWFPNYWGRDTFISLPGACLVTGEFDTAREILLSFMEYQERKPDSPYLGRFPNIVNPDNLQYSGVDGTWWLVRASWKYYEASHDRDFLIRAFPAIKLAIEGALNKATDEYGFLTHADHETWMDAGGEAHPYTPRGNRAVEVQALFYNGLVVGRRWAEEIIRLGDLEELPTGFESLPDGRELAELISKWSENAEKLKKNFATFFWNEKSSYLYDHLKQDGTPAGEVRPNAILAIWVAGDSLLTEEQYRKVVETALEELCFKHGVLSLSPRDKNFHPYHLNFGRYFFDEAYHNGDVWEWLNGPMASCLLKVGMTETAWELFEPLVTEILDEACVGSLREIKDGVFTPGKEEFGGATSQAWSLAEFIRTFHEGFIILDVPEKIDRFVGTGGERVVDASKAGIKASTSSVPVDWGRTSCLKPLVISGRGTLEDSDIVVIRGTVKPSGSRKEKVYVLESLSIEDLKKR